MWRLRYLLGINNTGLFRDNSYEIPRNIDELKNSLKITIQKLLQWPSQLLGVNLDLNSGEYKSYIKEVTALWFENGKSNHPLVIFKHLCKSMQYRLLRIMKSLNNEKYRNNTVISKYYWPIKERKGISPKILRDVVASCFIDFLRLTNIF